MFKLKLFLLSNFFVITKIKIKVESSIRLHKQQNHPLTSFNKPKLIGFFF